ncbi:MAG: hypothetical protein AVDCRST_MAG06-900 [uncultured Nocardioides sp.]|uniref:Uncharacterized protein n=1 Tax=uncultured Nocardioides sp. TaxID=198441 RepID=A0A6J4NAN2_9ACTN|nr:MAG: hypothetical protein AVDCRST_MAG06-900 [uncultured Nocardioides sp.]
MVARVWIIQNLPVGTPGSRAAGRRVAPCTQLRWTTPHALPTAGAPVTRRGGVR